MAVKNGGGKNGSGRFCSRKCNLANACRTPRHNTKHLQGKRNPNWKGGISKRPYRYTKRYKQRYPLQYAANKKVQYAIKKGYLTRQPCEVCGDKKVHAHHDDYNKPLEVRWLCRKHHQDWHTQLRKAQ